MARMRYEIILAPGAVNEWRRLRAHLRSTVRDAIERHLRYEPRKISRSRIKRLRGLEHPQYRLRVGDVRVFYDIEENRVEVLAIVEKAQATEWLKRTGQAGGPDESRDR